MVAPSEAPDGSQEPWEILSGRVDKLSRSG